MLSSINKDFIIIIIIIIIKNCNILHIFAQKHYKRVHKVFVLSKNKKNWQKVSKAHIPLAVAITGQTTLMGKKVNKWTDKQYMAEFFIHSTSSHI